jgi:DNA-binding response OmpR family regulator
MKKTKLLVADDDIFFQRLIEGLLAPEYDLVVAQDGMEAWHELQRVHAPRLAILDWVMPGLSGPQICRKVRASEHLSSVYLILLTAKNNESDIIAGLRSGADDYLAKPPLPAELRARIKMGERVLALQGIVKAQSTIAEGIDPVGMICRPHASVQQNNPALAVRDLTLNRCASPLDYSLNSPGENEGVSRLRDGQGEKRHSKH